MKEISIIPLLLITLTFMLAQENCTEEYCIIDNQLVNSEGEPINCDNFFWVENYIKKQIEIENASSSKIQMIDLLKTANYNLQDDINKLEEENLRYRYTFYGMTLLAICLVLYIYFRVRKMEDKVISSTKHKLTK